MAAIRLTAKEREFLTRKIDEAGCVDAKEEKLRAAVLSKLEASELKVKHTGLLIPEAIEAFKEVLGARLVIPPNGAAGVYMQIKRRIVALGLTRGDCTTVAKVAAVEWEGRIKVESLVRQADTLLAQAQFPLPGQGELPLRKKIAAPVEMGVDDL